MSKPSLLGLFVVLLLLAPPARADLASARLSLPKGPGSIEGLASSNFAPGLSTGQATYSIPIEVPPGARSFGPTLALTYDSGAGVGEMGLGWRLSGVPSVRRRPQDGLPRMDETDRFELVGLGLASELLEVRPGIFRPRYEDGSFVRAERRGDRWEVRTKAGQILSLGGPTAAVEEDGRIASFLLEAAYDLRGHEVRYEWRTEGGYPLLERVIWNDFGPRHRSEIRLEYEARPDVSRLFSAGIRQEIKDRLLRITVNHGGELVRRYELSYSQDTHPHLVAVQVTGADGQSRLPAARFRYSSGAIPASGSAGVLVELGQAPGRSPGESDAELVDLNGDGLPDLLLGQAGAYRSATNVDGLHFELGREWTSEASPSFSLSAAGVRLADFDGDGSVDLLTSGGDGSARYLTHSSETAFGSQTIIAGEFDLELEDPNVRLADLDGDRRTDLAMTTPGGLVMVENRNGTGFEPASPAQIIDPNQDVSFEDAGTDLCDVNGDRVLDICVLRPGSLVFYLGRGRGKFEPAEQGRGVPDFDANEPFVLRDLDGDGWDDLARIGVTEVSYALAVAEGRFGPTQTIQGVPVKGPSTYSSFVDMNGSGTVDILWVDLTGSEAASWRYLELFPAGRAGLLTEIDNGLGKKQTIAYSPAARFAAEARQQAGAWRSRLNITLPVVARVTVETGLGDPALVASYDYAEGTYDPSERTFAAFAVAQVTERGDESTPTLVTERHFDVGLERPERRGALLFEEKRTESGWVFSRQSREYALLQLETSLDGRRISYGYPRAILTETVEGGEQPVVTLSEMEQDEFGNVVLEQNWGVVQGDDYLALGDEAIVVRTFANRADDWVLGHLVSEMRRSAAGAAVSGLRKRYDGPAFEGLPLGEVARGEVTREEAWLGPGEDDFELVAATRYDEHGLALETKDARGGGRFFRWDEAHTRVVAEGVKLDPSDSLDAVRLVQRAEFDGRFGNLVMLIDYAGSVTRYDHDAFGRLTAVVEPGDSAELPTLRYRYEVGEPLSRIVTEARRESGERPVELREDLFDGLGRKRASFVQEGELWLLAGVDLYDARGQVRRSLLPRWVSEQSRRNPPLETDGDGHEVWRDALGRELRSQSAEGITTRTAHEAFRRLHWDGGQADESSSFEQTPTVTMTDGQGRIISHQRKLDGEALVAGYAYDAAGRLVSRVDPEGHQQRFAYDGRGRRVQVDDPDQGRHRFAYDGVGNLLLHEYPDGGRTRFSYDLAGRPESEDWDADGVPDVVKEYDRGSPYGSGRLVRVTEPSGNIGLTYDERGRVTETLHRIDGSDYRVGRRFDAQGREVEHTYPDGSRLALRRNARGQLSAYGELVRIEYGARGTETLRRFSSGVEAQSRHDLDSRPTEFTFRDADGEAVEHLSWVYDRGGNLVRVVDERSSISAESDRSAEYRYDNLQRLIEASGSWGTTEWRYSPSGNLLERTSSHGAQDAGRVLYGALAHGPTSVGESRITYDARGQMTSDGRRAYVWDGASQLVSVSLGDARVDSSYGHDGTRRARREQTADGATTTTHFIDSWSEVKDGRLIRYVVHAGQRLVRLADGPREAMPQAEMSSGSWLASLGLALLALGLALWGLVAREGMRGRPSLCLLGSGALALVLLAGCSRQAELGPDQVVGELVPGDILLITDQLGSLLAETDERGKRRATVALSPYGAFIRSESEETNQYAGTPRDQAVQLDHMGARHYSPELGLWTSADPVSLDDPERQITDEFAGAHSYAYANLRPLVAVDRDGRYWTGLIGAGIGILAGGTIETTRQYLEHGSVQSWSRVGVAAAGGGVAGYLASLVPPSSLVGAAAAGGAGKVAAGVAGRLMDSGGRSAGTLRNVAMDFASGAMGGVVAKGAGIAIQSMTSKLQGPVVSRLAGEADDAAK